MAVVLRYQEIKGTFKEASTLLDKPFSNFPHATVDAGVYMIYGGTPFTSSGYPALHIHNNESVPAWYGTHNSRTLQTADGIHIHQGYNNDSLTPGSETSQGCLTVHKDSYICFGKAVDLLENTINTLPTISTTALRNNPVTGVTNITGILVIDKSLFSG